MASQGPNSPSVGADDATVGTNAWTSPGNVTASDDVWASTSNSGAPAQNSLKLVKAGTAQGTDHSTGANLPAGNDAVESFGSASDLWGLTLSAADVNDAGFGLAVSTTKAGGTTSHYLKATGYGFGLPAGAVVNGVVAEVEWGAHFGGSTSFVDHARLTVYYTPAVVVLARVFSESGYCARAQLGM